MTVQGDERCLNDVTLQMLYPHIADGISAARKSAVRCWRGTIASTRSLISQFTDGHQLARAHWAQKRLFEVRFTPMELPEMLHCRRRRKCANYCREHMQQSDVPQLQRRLHATHPKRRGQARVFQRVKRSWPRKSRLPSGTPLVRKMSRQSWHGNKNSAARMRGQNSQP